MREYRSPRCAKQVHGTICATPSRDSPTCGALRASGRTNSRTRRILNPFRIPRCSGSVSAVTEQPTTEQRALTPAELVHAHQAGVWRYLCYLGAAPIEADDLTQETFLSVIRRPLEQRSPRETAGYLRTVARRQLLNLRRREGAGADAGSVRAGGRSLERSGRRRRRRTARRPRRVPHPAQRPRADGGRFALSTTASPSGDRRRTGIDARRREDAAPPDAGEAEGLYRTEAGSLISAASLPHSHPGA